MTFVHRSPAVAIDLIEAADYLAQGSLDTALRFLDAAESTFSFVAKNPEIGALCKFQAAEAQSIRFWPIKGFEKYLMFYAASKDGIAIVRVIHGARDLASILND